VTRLRVVLGGTLIGLAMCIGALVWAPSPTLAVIVAAEALFGVVWDGARLAAGAR
jgi:hypothetical protein